MKTHFSKIRGKQINVLFLLVETRGKNKIASTEYDIIPASSQNQGGYKEFLDKGIQGVGDTSITALLKSTDKKILPSKYRKLPEFGKHINMEISILVFC